MTDTDHEPTDQETAIYQALLAGDHDTIDELERAADEAGPFEAAQFDVDFQNAHAHYQADHEMPEAHRVENTAEAVAGENAP